MPIKPGDANYNTIYTSWSNDGEPAYVLSDDKYFRAIKAGSDVYFYEITPYYERTSFGSSAKPYRAPYPPDKVIGDK